MRKFAAPSLFAALGLAAMNLAQAPCAAAADVKVISSTENDIWHSQSASLQKRPNSKTIVRADNHISHPPFKSWGMTFNELDWDALSLLSESDRDELFHNFFAPEGDIRFNRGRISPGANDYARGWYSCDETPGDFELRHFNIDRDRQSIIPFIRKAQALRPDMTFWISPWSPPTWMKINGDYPVLSSKYNNMPPSMDYLLYSTGKGEDAEVDENEMKLTGDRSKLFPKRLATTDYFIQDERYLQAYADYFCRFISAYAEEGIPIDMAIYQNEAYSYTPYPGCAWTADGIIRFNRDYLAPTLKREHPEVKLYLGTFNTNRLDHVKQLLADEQLLASIDGLAFQWEGRDILPTIAAEHPAKSYICSESECGWGSFDWQAAEHTFELINHYLGHGCDEYTIWNCVLADNGESPWGWRQNALVRVDSDKRTFTYTPEYYAVKHCAHFITPGSRVVGHKGGQQDGMPVLMVETPEGDMVVLAGNSTDKKQKISVAVDGQYLNLAMPAHSLHTCRISR